MSQQTDEWPDFILERGKRIEKLKAELNASRREVERLREALMKCRAHTSYTVVATDPVPLLAGLLASIERICDAALQGAQSDTP